MRYIQNANVVRRTAKLPYTSFGLGISSSSSSTEAVLPARGLFARTASFPSPCLRDGEVGSRTSGSAGEGDGEGSETGGHGEMGERGDTISFGMGFAAPPDEICFTGVLSCGTCSGSGCSACPSSTFFTTRRRRGGITPSCKQSSVSELDDVRSMSHVCERANARRPLRPGRPGTVRVLCLYSRTNLNLPQPHQSCIVSCHEQKGMYRT